MGSTEKDDAAFAARAMAHLDVQTPSHLPAALLAAYDAFQTEQARGLGAALTAAWRRFGDIVWPGVPAWAPGGALAAALVIGIGVGTALPLPAQKENSSFSLAEPPAFSLGGEMVED